MKNATWNITYTSWYALFLKYVRGSSQTLSLKRPQSQNLLQFQSENDIGKQNIRRRIRRKQLMIKLSSEKWPLRTYFTHSTANGDDPTCVTNKGPPVTQNRNHARNAEILHIRKAEYSHMLCKPIALVFKIKRTLRKLHLSIMFEQFE